MKVPISGRVEIVDYVDLTGYSGRTRLPEEECFITAEAYERIRDARPEDGMVEVDINPKRWHETLVVKKVSNQIKFQKTLLESYGGLLGKRRCTAHDKDEMDKVASRLRIYNALV